MPLKLSPPIEKTFTLDKTDKLYGAEGTTVTIRQASQLQHERRQDLFASMQSRLTEDTGIVELVQRFNLPEVHRIEAMLTIIDCNIESEDGKPLFKFKKVSKTGSVLAMSEREFKEAWGQLPVDVATEIHEKILEVNPTWGASGEGL